MKRSGKNGGQLDLMEVFSGRGRVTFSAHHYGLNAMQPIDAVEGIDLMTFEGRSFGYSCTPRIQTAAAFDCVALHALEYHE